MNLLEKLTSIDKDKIQRQDLKEHLEGAIFEYDETDKDSVENAQTILDILTEIYPDIFSEKKVDDVKKEVKEAKPRKEEIKGKAPVLEIASSKENEKPSGKKEEKQAKSHEPEKKDTPERKKITKENRVDCENIVAELKSVLQRYQSTKPKTKKEKPKKKPLATVVKDSVVIIIKRVLNKEVERNPKKEIDMKEFNAMVKAGKDFFKSIRKFSGGISDDNEQIITSFENQMDELIESIKSKNAA